MRSLYLLYRGHDNDLIHDAPTLTNLLQAEDLLRNTLARVIEKVGRDNEAAATAINNLAYLLKAEGRLDESLDHYKEALEIRKKMYEIGHPQIIISLNNLAELCYAKGDEASGKAYQSEILEILQGREEPGAGSS